MQERLISVIVPVYNGAATLARCIDSVHKQTYRNIEIIIVDDGSEDESAKAASELARLYKNIRLVQTPHSGVSAARNAGIDRMRGEYVTFTDCDDTLSADMLSALAAQLDGGAELAVSGIERRIGAQRFFEPYSSDKTVCINNALGLYLKPMYFNSCSNKLYRADVIRHRGIRFCTDTEIGEDFLFNAEYARYAKKTAVISEPMYFYNMSGKTASPFEDAGRFDAIARMYRAAASLADGDASLAECVRKKICSEYLFALRLYCTGGAGLGEKIKNVREVIKSAEYRAVRGAEKADGAYGAAICTGSAFVICMYFYISAILRRARTLGKKSK